MSAKKTADIATMTVAVLGSLVLVNIIGIGIFGRVDMTEDNQFTLSRASKTTVNRLEEPVKVTAYFTKDLPPPHGSTARYVRDLLEEYYAAANDNFSYEFLDPTAEETEEDKEKKKEVKQDIFGRQVREMTSVEREMQSLGIPPVQVRVNEDDKLEVKRGYMGIAVRSGEKTEVIPLVSNTATLEYDLTTLMRKVTRDETPKVAVVSDLEPQELQQQYGRMMSMIGELYDVTPINLRTSPEIPVENRAIIVIGPKEPYGQAEVEAIDAFVMAGRSAAFLLDSVKPDLATMAAQEANHGLSDLLATYGVTIGDGLVVDAECATINITQQRGFMRISQPVRYPFMPLPKGLDPDNPLTRGLAQVAFPFMSPITANAPAGVTVEELVESSEKSFLAKPPYNLDPFQKWTPESVSDEGAKLLVVTLAGAIPSHTQKAPVEQDPNASTPAEDAAAVASSARVLVASGSSFVSDQFFSKTNEAFLLNLVDWMADDDDMREIRSRGLAAAPLAELSDGARLAVKWGNIFGVPILFVLFGVGRMLWRAHRRENVSL